MVNLAYSRLESGFYAPQGGGDYQECFTQCRTEYRATLADCAKVFTGYNSNADGGAAQEVCREVARNRLSECLSPLMNCTAPPQ